MMFNLTHLKEVTTENYAQTIINRLRYYSGISGKIRTHIIPLKSHNKTYYSQRQVRDIPIDKAVEYYYNLVHNTEDNGHTNSWKHSLEILEYLKTRLNGNMPNTTDEWDKIEFVREVHPKDKYDRAVLDKRIKLRKKRQQEFLKKWRRTWEIA